MASRDVYATGFDEESTAELSTTDCPECDGRLITDAGETSCQSCGLIIEAARLDRRGRPTYKDESRERTGAPLTNARHDRGLSTEIGRGVDANGNPLSDRKRRQLSRLRREHTRAKWQSKAERNLSDGCTEIARMVSAIGLDRGIREQASTLFRSAQDAGLLPGRSIEAMAAGAVYGACRCAKRSRTVEEIVAVARVGDSRVRNAYTVLNRELDLPVPPQRPEAFIPKLASAVEAPSATEREARQLAERATNEGWTTGRNPAGVAAACLEIASTAQNDDITQQELAAEANVCAATVRATRDTLQAALGAWSM